MSSEDWGVVLITAAAIASNLALLLYMASAKWYGSAFGRARVTAEFGWVALLDVALYAHWAHVLLPDWVRLTVYAVIAVGAWMWLGAVINEQFKRRKP